MIVFLDMDGVIVNFDGRVREITGLTSFGREEARDAMRTPNFFVNLDPLPGAISQVQDLLEWLPGQVQILSAIPQSDPGLGDEARAQKIQWLQEHIPELASTAQVVSDKGSVGTSDDILIDDHPDWNGADSFPGLVIRYSSFSDWGTLREEIQSRLDSQDDSSKLSRLIS